MSAIGLGRRSARKESPPSAPSRRRRRLDPLPYALITPLLVVIVGLAFIPAGMAIVQSFYRVQSLNPPDRFDGLNNFRRLFADSAIRNSLGNTAIYVVVGVALSTILGIMFAVTLQRPFRGRALLIAILILPWALPGVVEGIVWTGIWDANSGLLNSVLHSLSLIGNYQVFLGHSRWITVIAIELVQVWQMTPLSTLLVFAALQNIPGELYEAATLDGCAGWSTFRQITLPLVRPGVAIAMVQALVATLNVFDQPYVLNGAAATGASVTEQIYFVTFRNLDFGEGYAISLLITVATVALSLLIVKFVYRRVEF
ncbi:MAG: sugar ABC transporter permease [Actinomycetia bacterium]|nr:sugar ABC transporter permease [Actinomycetes bacterium]